MELSLLMDALRRAEDENGDQSATGADTALELEQVPPAGNDAPANETPPPEPPHEAAPQPEIDATPEDTGIVVEATLKPARPARALVAAALAGLAITLVATGGYYLWKQDGSFAAGGTLIATTPAAAGPVLSIPLSFEQATEHPSAPPAGSSDSAAEPAPRPATATVQQADTNMNDTAGTPEEPLPARIEIHRSQRSRSIDPTLVMAYNAYRSGDYLQAGRWYSQVLKRQPRNRDALLGIAGVALVAGDTDTARRYYERLLDISPGDTTARAALQSMDTGIDPLRHSSQLRHMLDSDPDNAHLHFSLANRYAELGKWKEAQQAYFDAARLDPEHADYAYNLAISLDHLGMNAEALRWYRRARELASRSAGLFDSDRLERRITELQRNTEPSP